MYVDKLKKCGEIEGLRMLQDDNDTPPFHPPTLPKLIHAFLYKKDVFDLSKPLKNWDQSNSTYVKMY